MLISLAILKKKHSSVSYELVDTTFSCVIEEFYPKNYGGRLAAIEQYWSRKELTAKTIVDIYLLSRIGTYRDFAISFGMPALAEDILSFVHGDKGIINSTLPKIKYRERYLPCVLRLVKSLATMRASEVLYTRKRY